MNMRNAYVMQCKKRLEFDSKLAVYIDCRELRMIIYNIIFTELPNGTGP